MKKIYFSALALCGILASAQVYEVGSGAQVIDLSNTGTAVGNLNGAAHFIWSEEAGGALLGEAGENGTSGNETISADGEIISATVINPDTGVTEAAYYTVSTDTWTYLSGLGTILDGDTSSSWGMSSNGEHIVGLAWVPGGSAHGAYWNLTDPSVDLGSTVEGRSSRANSVSADGSRVVGWQDSDFGDRQGVYWENGVQTILTDQNGNILGEAAAISADGKTITGYTVDGQGYIWREGQETLIYNHFADSEFPEDYWTSVTSISDDGKTAVGFSFNPFDGGMLFGKSFIWTEADGFKDLKEYVTQELGYETNGLELALATAISPNGNYIGGIGANFDIGDAIGYVIKRSTMGTQDQSTIAKTSVYPNPVKETLNFKSEEKINSVEIMNVVGQNVMKAELSNNSLNVAHLTKGVYFVKIKTDKGIQTIKFIKQ